MTFPELAPYTDVALLLLRLMVALVFLTSGLSHLKNPAARSQSIGMSKPFTIFLGAAEFAGGLGMAFGVLATVNGIGDFVSSVVVGALWSALGTQVAFGYSALLFAAGAWLVWRLRPGHSR